MLAKVLKDYGVTLEGYWPMIESDHGSVRTTMERTCHYPSSFEREGFGWYVALGNEEA